MRHSTAGSEEGGGLASSHPPWILALLAKMKVSRLVHFGVAGQTPQPSALAAYRAQRAQCNGLPETIQPPRPTLAMSVAGPVPHAQVKLRLTAG